MAKSARSPGDCNPPQPQDVKDALGMFEDMRYLIKEKFDDAVRAKGGGFFTSVLKRAKDICETVRRTNRVSPAQREALENMRRAVKKWDHEDDDDDD